jgi:ABC-type sugar transport system substrate-binding protein
MVELILAGPPNANRIFLIQTLRREMGKAAIVFRTSEAKPAGPGSDEAQSSAPLQLAKLISAALVRGVLGLIVEPIDHPAVSEALAEAQNRGVKILVLDRAVAGRGGKPIPCVTYVSFSEPGRQIVSAALESARLLYPRGTGRILILHSRSPDPYAVPRLASLSDALKASGRSFETIEFEGDSSQAGAALRQSLAAGPSVEIVLADEEQGMGAAYQVRREWAESHPEFLFGGYLAYDFRSAGDMLTQATVFADRSIESFAVKASQAMRSLLDGKPVSERIEIPIPIHRRRTVFVPVAPKEAPASK